MAKRAKKRSTRRRRYAKRFRRRMPKRVSLLTVAGLAGGAMTTFAGSGDVGLIPQIEGVLKGQKSYKDIPRVFIRDTLGYDYQYKKWVVPSITALTMLGVVGSKVVGRFVKPSTFDAIPWVGKKIKL